MMNIFLMAIVMVQIITEFLPISSSGHVALVSSLLDKIGLIHAHHYSHMPVNTIIALPNVVMIILFFRREWYTFALFFVRRKKRIMQKIIFKLFGYVSTSGVASVIGLMLFRLVAKNVTGVRFSLTLALGFCITALVLFSLKSKKKECAGNENKNALTKDTCMTMTKAFIIGCMQAVALLPGISRLASTYVVARWLHISPRRAFQYSFLIGVPSMLAGCCIDVMSHAADIPWSELCSLPTVGISLGAACVSWGVLGSVYSLALQEKLWRFSYYMVVPIVLTLIMIIS